MHEPPALTTAFESFARASVSLEAAYAGLRGRVDELSARLEETERELTRSLEENERLHEAAERKSRLEAMGRMAAELAHEIRNPLGGLELTASLLRDDLEHDPGRHELAVSILEGIRSLTRVTGNLLTFTRSVQPRIEILDAAGCVEATRDLARAACAAHGIRLDLACSAQAEALTFAGDRELFQQILLNLVQNALEASREGGTVTLEVAPGGDEVAFRVVDDGPGMDEATLSKVFDPFFTTRHGGTGLGLSIAFRLAEAQQARLELQSAPGRGTVATLTYPALLEGAAR